LEQEKKAAGGLYDHDQQSKLELAYLSDPKVFDRDSATRRSEARRKLKEITGMDDAQLEGWRVMLERNPHKEAILARHTFAPKKNYLGAGSDGARGSGGSKGKGKGGGEGGSHTPSGNESGRGGKGGRGGGSGGGGGGGRGRGGNKGSRGHSNAARTRGHDRKMTRMGAGV
jgi:activating signal cointegrator complex subunit 2